MSDDEEDGQLHIDESPPFDEPTSSEKKKTEPVAKPEENSVDVGKEDGELDDDDTDSEKEKVLQIDEEESTSSKDDPREKEKTPESEKPTPKKSVAASESSSEMRPPQSTEKPRKRKESMENHRKSGLDAIEGTPSTPQRSSKRQSSQMAQSLISACFHDDDIVSVPPMSIGTTPTSTAKRQKLSSVTVPASPLKEGTSGSNGNGGQVQTRDASTSVITTRSLDTAGLVSNDNIMDTPPGTTRLVEVTVMYRTRSAVAFKVNGTEVLGFFGTGLPEFTRDSNGPGTSGSGGKKKEDSKDGRSSSASNNGRSTRGSSVVDNKSDKGREKGKRRKDELIDEDVDEESMHGIDEAKGKLELIEVDFDQLHDCSFPDCHKRFRQSAELEYHISKNHKNRVLVYESICTQTDLSMTAGKVDVAIETDEGMQNMPVLEMESAEVPPKAGLVYEDLSDDEPPTAELAIKAPPQSSATAALQGLVQATASIGQPTPSALQLQQKSAISTPMVSRMNPAMMGQSVEKRKQQMQQQPQKSAFSPRASQPPSSVAGSVTMPTSSAPQMIPLQSFFPGGYQPMPPGLMMNHHLFQHQQQQLHQQQLQQAISRTPSRQMPDAHKIHELKAKENEQRQRQASATPKTSAGTPGNATPQRQFVHPHLMQGTPTTIQQQQSQANALQMHQFQMFRNQLQPEVLAMMMNCLPGPGGFPGTPQQPPPK